MSCTSGCSTVREIITRAANILNDFDHETGTHIRWHQSTLIAYLHESLCELQAHRPDAFACTQTLTLRAGSSQELPSNLQSLVRIEQNNSTGESGAVVDGPTISEADERISRAFKKKACLSSAAEDCFATSPAPYKVGSYTKNPFDEAHFTVSPPVPQGQTATVRAVVVRRPARISATDLDAVIEPACKYEAQLVDWVVMRAYETDTESATSMAMAKQHREHFYLALASKYLQAQRQGSGLYLGLDPKTPDADQRFRAH
jgi:hypothetical protein